MSYFSYWDPHGPENQINFEIAQMEIQRWSLLIPNPEADASTLIVELRTIVKGFVPMCSSLEVLDG
ncbi:hypothetical protein [Corynebacterium crudilactis]|uniref:Uncharacterized protein n=1 Tax=Corynebacterium crudilactis TaxID=1652495 RepID=A0A172QV83_9CORY|nr:hypothetical protein [Corynebacterium crudilactis]ANE04623.1 hypothetical protein ccrud_10680 [Corynebacterium crudilactis]